MDLYRLRGRKWKDMEDVGVIEDGDGNGHECDGGLKIRKRLGAQSRKGGCCCEA